MSLEIEYEPPTVSFMDVVHRIENITLRKLDYFYKKDQFGDEVNTFLCYFQDEGEMQLAKSCIDNKPKQWADYGIKSVKGKNKVKNLIKKVTTSFTRIFDLK